MFLRSIVGIGVACLCLVGCSEPPPTTVTTVLSETATLPPTATDTPTPSPKPTQTPTATPTPDATATQAAQATATTRAILEIIGPDLEQSEVFPLEEGRLAFFQTEPFTLTLDSFRENQMFPIANRQVFSDFVLQSDITWRSRVGLAVCGFSFRSGPNLTEDLHYEFAMLRLEGVPAWEVAVWQGSQSLGSLTEEVMRSRAIDQAQGATNRVRLVVRGDQITFYVNGQREPTLVDDQIDAGILAYLAGHESGHSICKFENTWVWDLSGAASGN